MERIYLYVWIGASAALTLTSILVRTIRGQSLPPSEIFFKASVTLGGAIMMLRVFLKVFSSDGEKPVDYCGKDSTVLTNKKLPPFNLSKNFKTHFS